MFELEIIACRQSFENTFTFIATNSAMKCENVFSNDCLHALTSDSKIIFNKVNLVDVIPK
jgi:hypothetical protein